jgi:SOS-response transcriptional repressor LexA
LTLDRRLAGDKGAFFVQASSSDLTALGCLEGDYVLLEPASPSDLANGAIVAASVDGPPGYYRFVRNGLTAELHRVGGKGVAAVVDDPSDLRLVGRVTGLYRRLDHASASVTAITH